MTQPNLEPSTGVQSEGRDRPILFSGPMVRALLAGRKTQTRRAIKPIPLSACASPLISFNHGIAEYSFGRADKDARGLKWWRCPYGQPGDRLWVRETYQVEPHPAQFVRVFYAKDEATEERRVWPAGDPRWMQADRLWTEPDVWRPSIHMPRWASRITLEVTDVRVERLQDISEEDAQAEGITHWGDGFHWEANAGWPGEPEGMKSVRFVGLSAKQAYMGLWEQINGRESLDANPWVWAVSFRTPRA